MTAKEALGQLRCNSYGDYINEDDLIAFGIAAAALEKQIPKKLIFRREERGFIARDFYRRESYLCPSCGLKVFVQNHIEKDDGTGLMVRRFPQGNKTLFCHHCGQRLDWSETK